MQYAHNLYISRMTARSVYITETLDYFSQNNAKTYCRIHLALPSQFPPSPNPLRNNFPPGNLVTNLFLIWATIKEQLNQAP